MGIVTYDTDEIRERLINDLHEFLKIWNKEIEDER